MAPVSKKRKSQSRKKYQRNFAGQYWLEADATELMPR
jgi:hypothetical protein